MQIEWDLDEVGWRRPRWRNLITGECRFTAPQPGELDWIETSSSVGCCD